VISQRNLTMRNRIFTFVFSVMLSLPLLFLLAACKNGSPGNDKNVFWKYSDGFSIGDAIRFDGQHNRVENDTVFQNEMPVAKFIKIESRVLAGDRLLHIKDLATGKAGIYVEK
jgi:hypothetical protein